MFASWQQTSDLDEQEAVFANISAGIKKLLMELLLGTMPTFFLHWSSGVHLQCKDREFGSEKKFWMWARIIYENWKLETT